MLLVLLTTSLCRNLVSLSSPSGRDQFLFDRDGHQSASTDQLQESFAVAPFWRFTMGQFQDLQLLPLLGESRQLSPKWNLSGYGLLSYPHETALQPPVAAADPAAPAPVRVPHDFFVFSVSMQSKARAHVKTNVEYHRVQMNPGDFGEV